MSLYSSLKEKNYKIINFLRNSKLRTRLIFSFMLLSLAPLIFVGTLSYVKTYRESEKRAIQFSEKICSQMGNNVKYIYDDNLTKFRIIVHNGSILNALNNYLHEDNKSTKIKILSRIQENLSLIVGTSHEIDAVEIISINGDRFYNSFPITRRDIKSSGLINRIKEKDGIFHLVSRKEKEYDINNYIIFCSKLKHKGKVIGYVLMTTKLNNIERLRSQNSEGTKQYLVVVDDKGNIISHPNENKISKEFDQDLFGKINVHNTYNSESNSFKINYNGELKLITYNNIATNNWKVINIMSYSSMMESAIHNGRITIITAILCILIITIYSFTVTNSISMPVNNLLNAMNKVGEGNLNVTIHEDWKVIKDEHAELSKGFNNMVSQLNTLINEVYEGKIKENKMEFLIKDAELNALQQQINPHFLYNTLESIYWLAQLKGEEEICDMITALGDFFRTSINRGLNFISIYDEINNVKNYIYIQKIRFRDRLHIQWEIDNSILDYKTVKLVLQPVIENAIVHGVEQLQKDGLIIIKGYKKDKKIFFQVTDNGMGMSKEKLETLKSYINSKETSTRKSVGIRNVNQRIKLYYGDEYGLEIESEEGKYTNVTIVLKAIKDENVLNFNIK